MAWRLVDTGRTDLLASDAHHRGHGGALLRAATLVADRLGDVVRKRADRAPAGLVLAGAIPSAERAVTDESAFDSLTVVVLDWNHADLAIRSVEGILAEGVAASRVVVVDNGSTEENWERLSASLGDCHFVRLDENTGFARGNNAGARALEGSATSSSTAMPSSTGAGVSLPS